MKTTLQPCNFIDTLGVAYEALLENTLQKAQGGKSAVRQMVDIFLVKANLKLIQHSPDNT